METDFNITTLSWMTGSTVAPAHQSDTAGYIGVIVAIIFFGTNLVPVKNANTGDGIFYQWIACTGIWLTGLVVHLIRGCPTFQPIAMLGGFLWTTGNITVIPIIKTIGLSLGILIWGSLNLLAGWASGRFGLFGLDKDVITRPAFNYSGVALAMLSVVVSLFLKPSVGVQLPEESEHLLSKHVNTQVNQPLNTDDASWVDNLSPTKKRVMGICLSMVAGIFYGVNFVPCLWIQDHIEGASENGLDYVFSHFCGILFTSSTYFFVYCILKKNQPQLPPGIVLPSLVSGVMWGIADSGWFVANFYLSQSVAFPVITTGPAIIASLWGVFYFHEIRGIRNYIILTLTFVVTIAGAVLTAFSRL
ncbi:transmembrane protein 144-like isoform X2 [Anneissia japonica]|uniref:transmembrane protein 144-like isoform X2 n=1 Tax=Anneissia japonica TaxID=1529436 RepID=UPI0014255667|nr:transmembrane protein 144-like isoform X2 [Anneissia japonica]